MVVGPSLISCYSLSLVLVLIQFCAVFHISISEEENDEDLDEKIAFDVPGQQRPLDVARGFPDSPTGYVVYCPCMGRFGNQADQFLGALAFAKGLNRTLVLPPWIVYSSRRPMGSDRIPFDNWFRVKPLQAYHNVITMENFMKDTAPRVWPAGQRIGFCYSFREGKKCAMKEGNPFGPFWDHFHVNFDDYREHSGLLWDTDEDWARNGWNARFPVSDYPVIALMGAPGAFPVEEKNRWLQKFVRWSPDVENIAKEFVNSVLKKEPFVGIHLRNGIDFEKACSHINDPRTTSLFASPQCITARSSRKLTFDMCLPPKKEVLKKTKKIVKRTKAKKVFVATDNDPMITELTKTLKSLEVTVHKRPAFDEASDPVIDLAILTMADHFIGNCVSSFTSFVTRYRAVDGKPTSFWAFDDQQ